MEGAGRVQKLYVRKIPKYIYVINMRSMYKVEEGGGGVQKLYTRTEPPDLS